MSNWGKCSFCNANLAQHDRRPPQYSYSFDIDVERDLNGFQSRQHFKIGNVMYAKWPNEPSGCNPS